VSEEENPKEAKARRAFGERLKKARKAAGLSQAALGDKCEWLDSQSRISMYETGQRWPSPLEVALMASFVDATPGHLLFGEQMPVDGPIVQREFKKEHRVLLRQILNLPDKFQDALRKLIAEGEKLAHPRGRARAPTETGANEEEKHSASTR
jgi:transcriptional regulator with XRE-family HTH domain